MQLVTVLGHFKTLVCIALLFTHYVKEHTFSQLSMRSCPTQISEFSTAFVLLSYRLNFFRTFVETKLSNLFDSCKFFANFFRFIFNLSFEVVLLKQRYKLFCNCATLF